MQLSDKASRGMFNFEYSLRYIFLKEYISIILKEYMIINMTFFLKQEEY